eukprot:m.17210 g.17210  ORF g.17210 m.17210 type:complete len:344 (+) comp5942_c0_seq1:141-1172(+)
MATHSQSLLLAANFLSVLCFALTFAVLFAASRDLETFEPVAFGTLDKADGTIYLGLVNFGYKENGVDVELRYRDSRCAEIFESTTSNCENCHDAGRYAIVFLALGLVCCVVFLIIGYFRLAGGKNTLPFRRASAAVAWCGGVFTLVAALWFSEECFENLPNQGRHLQAGFILTVCCASFEFLLAMFFFFASHQKSNSYDLQDSKPKSLPEEEPVEMILRPQQPAPPAPTVIQYAPPIQFAPQPVQYMQPQQIMYQPFPEQLPAGRQYWDIVQEFPPNTFPQPTIQQPLAAQAYPVYAPQGPTTRSNMYNDEAEYNFETRSEVSSRSRRSEYQPRVVYTGQGRR